MLILALMSRLCWAPQFGHSQSRTARFLTRGFLYPQQLQVCELGYIVGTLIMLLPYHAALYSNISKNLDHETLAIDFASLWLRSIPLIFKFSMQMVWFSRTNIVDCFWRKSFRWLVIFSWTNATLTRCLLRFLEPFCLRESLRCSRASFLVDLSKYFGFSTTLPLLSE